MKNVATYIKILLLNIICIALVILNSRLFIVDKIWDFFVLIFLFITNIKEFMDCIKIYKNEKNVNG